MSPKKSIPFNREIGINIRYYCEEKRIPRNSFAKSLFITPQQLSNIENGNITDIGIARIVEVARILGIEYQEIIKTYR